MPVSSQVVANAFIRLADSQGKRLTNMQLQKLVFLAHGYTLAMLDQPLYFHNTHAWQWGPVIPKLYKDLQKYGSGCVESGLQLCPNESQIDENSEEYEIIKGVWNAYGNYTGGQLSALTHRAETPWSKTWHTTPFGVIPNDAIRDFYRGLLEQN